MMRLKLSPKTILIEMIKLILMVVLVANIVSFIKKPELVDTTIPDISVTLLNKETKSLRKYIDKPLVLYFWGSWCPICKMSSPVISDLSENYQVVAFAVNSGSNEDIKAFMKEHQLNFPVVNDADGSIAQKFGVDTFPTTFIYNKRGSNSFIDIGYTSGLSLKLKIWLSQFID